MARLGIYDCPDFSMRHALAEIEEREGAVVAYKAKSLSKFGRYASLGTSFETVQEQGGNETYLTDNLIDTVVSSIAGDTQLVAIEGHTIDGSGNLTFVRQEATLTGDTGVTLTTPLARATRIENLGATNFAGTVTVIDADAPSTIYVRADGTFNRSQKAATSVSKDDWWVITQVMGSVLKKTTAVADFSLQVRRQGGVLQEVYGFDGSSASQDEPHSLKVPIIVPPNSDVVLKAKASTTAVEVIGRISGYLANSG